MNELLNVESIETFIRDHDIVLIFASMPSCGVCQPLMDKVSHILEQKDAKRLHMGHVDLEQVPEAQGLLQVYTAPIILVFVQGKELKRYGAALDIQELKYTVERYLTLMQED